MKYLNMEGINSILDRHAVKPEDKKLQSTRHQQVALDIATDFDDLKSIGIYMKICKKLNLDYVVRMAKKVKSNSQIRNKGRYFASIMLKKDDKLKS